MALLKSWVFQIALTDKGKIRQTWDQRTEEMQTDWTFKQSYYTLCQYERMKATKGQKHMYHGKNTNENLQLLKDD